MTKYFQYITLLLAMGFCLIACKDDDSVDYTKYYNWRDNNNEMTLTFLNDLRTLGNEAYFSDSLASLAEPYAYCTMYHVIESANEDSLRRINRWITPYYNSTLRVHYTLFNPDSVWARFQQYDILTDVNRRNDAELMNKIFGIGYRPGMDGYELKADTLESYQVRYFDNFNPSGVVKGWQDCLQRMHIGDNWLIMVPWYLAYGQAGSGDNIDPYTNLFFCIKLVDITYWGGTVNDNEE